MSVPPVKERALREPVALRCSLCGKAYAGVVFARSLSELQKAKEAADSSGVIARNHAGCIARKFGRPR